MSLTQIADYPPPSLEALRELRRTEGPEGSAGALKTGRAFADRLRGSGASSPALGTATALAADELQKRPGVTVRNLLATTAIICAAFEKNFDRIWAEVVKEPVSPEEKAQVLSRFLLAAAEPPQEIKDIDAKLKQHPFLNAFLVMASGLQRASMKLIPGRAYSAAKGVFAEYWNETKHFRVVDLRKKD